MKITRAHAHAYRIPFQNEVHTAKGVFTHREGWVIEVEDVDGHIAFGDAAPWPGFGSNPDVVAETVHGWISDLPKLENLLFDPTVNLQALPVECAHAIDCLRLDLEGQRQGKTISELLHASPAKEVKVYALVNTGKEAQGALEQGYTHLKTKVGHQPVEEEMARLNGIRRVAPKTPIHLDANGAWTLDEAHSAFERFSPLRPAWIEEPLKSRDMAETALLRQAHPVGIALDESLTCPADLDQIIAMDAADKVVIKPMFCGGLRAAHALACSAISHGLQVVITHALESVVGRTAALHLAAALPENPCQAGLSAGYLADEQDGVPCIGGILQVPTTPGLGVHLTQEWRAAWTH